MKLSGRRRAGYFLGLAGSIGSILGLWYAVQPREPAATGETEQAVTVSGTGNTVSVTESGDIDNSVTVYHESDAAARGEAEVPKLYGLSYDEAREKLIQAGWIPLARHWTDGTSSDVQSGNGPIFWERGYTEISACSGTGYAYCRFEFYDPGQRRLSVVTEGEESEDDTYHATVARVFLKDGDDDQPPP